MDQENELLELSGTVENIIYKNEENGYTVLRLKNDSGELVTVVGCFPYAAAGESMIISGNWMNHSVHGRQFKAEFAQRLLHYVARESVEGSRKKQNVEHSERFGYEAVNYVRPHITFE